MLHVRHLSRYKGTTGNDSCKGVPLPIRATDELFYCIDVSVNERHSPHQPAIRDVVVSWSAIIFHSKYNTEEEEPSRLLASSGVLPATIIANITKGAAHTGTFPECIRTTIMAFRLSNGVPCVANCFCVVINIYSYAGNNGIMNLCGYTVDIGQPHVFRACSYLWSNGMKADNRSWHDHDFERYSMHCNLHSWLVCYHVHSPHYHPVCEINNF